MATLALSNGKLFAISQTLLACSNDILKVNAIPYEADSENKETVDLMVDGFRRPTILDIANHIVESKAQYAYDWAVQANSLESHGYLTMDRFIDIKDTELGIRITMNYSSEDDSVTFSATSNDEHNGDDCTYELTDEQKSETLKAVKSFSAEFKNMCDASDITIDISEDVKFT